jgi:hypothetical protein
VKRRPPRIGRHGSLDAGMTKLRLALIDHVLALTADWTDLRGGRSHQRRDEKLKPPIAAISMLPYLVCQTPVVKQ